MPERQRWWELIKNEASPGSVTVRIYGAITSWPWLDGEMSASGLIRELEDAGDVSQIELHVNSPGGEAYEGIAMMNALRQHPARVTAHVDGMAASAASVVIMGADEVVMHSGAQIMVHDPLGFAYGFAADVAKVAADLDHHADSMAAIYAERAGGTAAEWREIMRAETWYSGAEAVEAGLADRVAARQKDEKEPDAAAVAAMLRRSPVAAAYRYQGRAQAPAPRTPVRADGSGTEGGRSVEITDEDFAALRTGLGLGDDAEIGDVLDAIQDRQADKEPVAAKLPAGVVTLDADALASLQRDAALGREAREAQVQARRVATVDAAIQAGKVVPGRRDYWLAQINADEEGITATLAALQPIFGTSEIGHDDGTGTVETGEASPEVVRQSPAYAQLRKVF